MRVGFVGAGRMGAPMVARLTQRLREELGPEFEDLRQPLNEIQKLRGMTPRAAITKICLAHLPAAL